MRTPRKKFNTHPKEREYTRIHWQLEDRLSGAQHERYMRYQIPYKTCVLVADSEYNLHDIKNSYLSVPNSGCTLTSIRRKK
jgi:hypothetical protein